MKTQKKTVKTAKSKRSLVTRRANIWGWGLTIPFGIAFILFLLVPLIYAFYLSMFSYTQLWGSTFTGLSNYIRAFTDPIFLSGLGRVILYSIVMVPIQIGLALVLALIIDSLHNRFASISRLIDFLPYAIPGVIGALLWGFMYSKTMGPFATIFDLFGLPAPEILTEDGLFGALVNLVTWQWTGYYMVILYSGLQSISTDIYESARIDGASEIQIALRIKTPMISSSIIMVLIFSIVGSLQFFTEPTVMRGAAPSAVPATYTPNMYVQNLAANTDTNYAATISFALGTIVIIFSFIFMQVTKRQSGLEE
ncbi:sugar ABC transporter permease [Bifidobacterium pullorum subsp. gallinarum]|uniref:Sugar ABC transporter permease n=1 Tax=Bifidobacterium pullorum subsp. gallinarum TaxID=78344 RepID=A0A4V0YAY5_9BIFI|nr:sugar ABC transporter permease [Bifidobacterium pullorum]QAY32372.1 sugar ABC transporter permease [Bifidobacterium pullorum subsp. gallinarum]